MLVEGTVKFVAEKVILWECIRWEDIGYVCRIEGKIDGELYELISEDNSLGY